MFGGSGEDRLGTVDSGDNQFLFIVGGVVEEGLPFSLALTLMKDIPFVLLTLATWIIASTPSNAPSSKTPVAAKSFTTTKSSFFSYSGRACFMIAPFSALRVAPRTRYPFSSRLSTTWAPMNPVAPVTRTYLANRMPSVKVVNQLDEELVRRLRRRHA